MPSPASVALVATNAVFMCLATVSVLLRFYIRRRKHVDLGSDDYLIIASLIFSAFLATVNIVGVPVGHIGEPFQSLNAAEAESFLKIAFTLQFPYVIAVALVKLSILCFYGRIFQLGQWPLSIKLLMAVVIGWLIAFLFATMFQAWPISCNWLPCTPTTDYASMYVACSATNVVLEVAILAAPATFIRQVRMSSHQKTGVIGIFGLGIFCVVASICRLAYTICFLQADLDNFDTNFDVAAVNIIMWSGIEANASTLCANLPTYYPIFIKLRQLGFLPGRTTRPCDLSAYAADRTKPLPTPPTAHTRRTSATLTGYCSSHTRVGSGSLQEKMRLEENSYWQGRSSLDTVSTGEA